MEKLTMDIVERYNGEGYVIEGDTSAIIMESGPEWGPSEWWRVKYYGKFSEDRLRTCFSQALQELRRECNKTDCNLWTNNKRIERIIVVGCDWPDIKDCFERMELRLCWISEKMLELNVSVVSRPIMRSKDGGWWGFTEYWLGRMEREEMLEWINGAEILDECIEMISDLIREQYIE